MWQIVEITWQSIAQLAQWRCANVTTSWLTLSQRCGTLKHESWGEVGHRHCDNVAVQRYQDVASTLLQHRHNINQLVSRPFYYGLFWFFSRHRNVRELQKYLSIWQARRTLVKSWLCLLLVCEQDKVARLSAKVAMKGLGRGKKRLSTTSLIYSLTFQLFQTDEVFMVNGRETHTHTHTHTHTQKY